MKLLMLLSILLSWPMISDARCTTTGATNTADIHAASISFGKVNLSDNYLQPAGSLIASTVVPSSSYKGNNSVPSTVLWRCDRSDLNSIYFLVATNGDDRVGGYYDIGIPDGLSNVYATWFAYVGIRFSMSGVTLSRTWQRVNIPSYVVESTGKIAIRLQDIPSLQAEIYKVSNLPANSATTNFCSARGNKGLGYGSATGTNYNCNQPNAYVQLSGDSNVSFAFTHDNIGDDSASHYHFFGSNNGFGYGLYSVNTLYSNPSCVVRNVTPHVAFPAMTASQLTSGNTVSKNFTLTMECNNNITSGVNNLQIAYGLQVSPGAYQAAQSLNLVNSSGGVQYLVSDNYFDSSMAKGVAIKISNSSGSQMNLLAQPIIIPLSGPKGNAAGWYSALNGAVNVGTNSNYTRYTQTLTATLVPLPSVAITNGNISATAYVLVRMQ